jgi:hypothetical protein
MEQNNLVVTPDGKSWDEVTRDTSYIGFHCGFNISIDGGNMSGVQIWDTTRGGYNANHRDAVQKNWAIAYDRMICLKEGWYNVQWVQHSRSDGYELEGYLRVNGTQVLHSQADPEGTARASLGYPILLFFQRGDYIDTYLTSTGEGTDSTYNEFSARLITG